MENNRLFRIREIAQRCGVSTRTVDYYTQLGLIEPVNRSSGNYRLYDEGAVQRLQLIKLLQAQRLSLQEIRAQLTDGGQVGGTLHALERIGDELAKVEHEVTELSDVLAKPRAVESSTAAALRRVASDAMARALAVAQVLAAIANENLTGRL